MNKKELVAVLAAKAGVTKKDAEALHDALFAAITEEVAAGGRVQVTGFGTFERVERAARKGINPQTQEPLDIPAKNAVRFKVGKGFKDAVEASKLD